MTSEVSDHTSVLQFLEKWTTAIGKPAICPNISEWRRSVSGDLLSAFDFQHPVYGLPELPFVSAPVGEANSYEVLPSDNALPAQEPGNKPARPLPYQANANLTGFTTSGGTVTASLALSNNAPFASKASVFAVYDNLAATPAVASYPAGFPSQYTVAPTRKVTAKTEATVPLGAAGPYDITVVSANRFLRRFTGDTTKAGATANATASYYAGGFGLTPALILELSNGGRAEVTFTVTHNHYSTARPASYQVRPGFPETFAFDVLALSGGWYDVTVTVSGDGTWSRRFTGHVENGRSSVTGSTVTA